MKEYAMWKKKNMQYGTISYISSSGNEVLRIGRGENPINEPQDLLQDEKN